MTAWAGRLAALLVAAVTLGVLMMHALSLGSGSHAAHHAPNAHATQASHVAAAAETVTGVGGSEDDGVASTVMLCGAMLLAAGALLVLRPGRRPMLPWAPALPALRGIGHRSTERVLSARPPPAWRFSVVRC